VGEASDGMVTGLHSDLWSCIPVRGFLCPALGYASCMLCILLQNEWFQSENHQDKVLQPPPEPARSPLKALGVSTLAPP
jgi:hypothetical protein